MRPVAPKLAQTAASLIALGSLAQANIEFYEIAHVDGVWLPRLGPAFFVFAAASTAIMFVVLASVWSWKPVESLWGVVAAWRNLLGWARWPLYAITLCAPLWFFQYSRWGELFSGPFFRLFLVLGAGAFAATLISRQNGALFNAPTFISALLLVTAVISTGKAFSNLSNYPFSLYWSEGNRFWDYSVLFGRRLYDYPTDKSIFTFIDLGRQSLWGMPWLFGDISIWQMRAWNGIINTLPYALFGWLLFHDHKHRMSWLLAGIWIFLYLRYASVYAPLVLSAALVAIAWRRPLWLALLLVGLAGYYAQLTRFTWMFAPATWAGMLALCEPARPITYRAWRSWAPALALIAAGLFGGYIIPRLDNIARAVGISSASVPTPQAASALKPDIVSLEGITQVISRQPLLWERLLPNETFSTGILLALVLAIVPLAILLWHASKATHWYLMWWQIVVLSGSLLAFLMVGIVVSVKIGGGSDLHNMDMFMISCAFALALVWRAGGSELIAHLESQPAWLHMLLAFTILIFGYKHIMEASPLNLPDLQETRQVLEEVQNETARAKVLGEVLFMDQRQLLTFGSVQDVPLVTAYEKKLLMERALTEQVEYFKGFYSDLEQHRFALIISEPLRVNFRGSDYQFGDENDAWVKWVSIPVLCYYEPAATYKAQRLELLIPRKKPRDCSKVDQLLNP